LSSDTGLEAHEVEEKQRDVDVMTEAEIVWDIRNETRWANSLTVKKCTAWVHPPPWRQDEKSYICGHEEGMREHQTRCESCINAYESGINDY